jgi:hypothetical protein
MQIFIHYSNDESRELCGCGGAVIHGSDYEKDKEAIIKSINHEISKNNTELSTDILVGFSGFESEYETVENERTVKKFINDKERVKYCLKILGDTELIMYDLHIEIKEIEDFDQSIINAIPRNVKGISFRCNTGMDNSELMKCLKEKSEKEKWNIKKINLDRRQNVEDFLKHIPPSLVNLKVENCNYKMLEKMTGEEGENLNIEFLDLRGSNITTELMIDIGQKLRALRMINLEFCKDEEGNKFENFEFLKEILPHIYIVA